MNHKVLLADDSLTIQKVIKITLANQPYDITDCSSEEELFSVLSDVKPEIVFLDFNLSESKTGYELCSQIIAQSPKTKVLLLLGTFDSVEDKLFEKSGASDKIVKPFDSNKFISICKELVKTTSTSADDEILLPSDEDLEYPEIISSSEKDELDQWEVNSTSKLHSEVEKEEHEEIEISIKKHENILEREMSDWGMSVPQVISPSMDEIDLPELPPVINLNETAESIQAAEQNLPSDDDLEYPDVADISQKINNSPKKSSELISLDNFKDVPQEMEIQGNYVPDETDVKSIEDQIRDEVEEDLWKADEFEAIKVEVKSKIQEIETEIPISQKNQNIFDEKMFEPLDKDEKQASFDQVSNTQIEELVKKYVQEYLDKMFKESIEKVSWEIIPDLAENLIKKELEKISNKVIDD